MNPQLERKILAALNEKNLSFWELLEKLDFGEAETLKTLEELQKKGKIKAGKKIISKLPKKKVLNAVDKKIFYEFNKLTSQINPLNSEYYQERVSIKDIIKKLAFIDKREDLFNAELVFLGDDDFCSIAAMLTKKPKNITVLEIDPEIINTINKISKRFEKKGYPKIECIQLDLSKKIPKQLRNKFDVFICEPPEAINGMESFISNGLSLMKQEGCAGYIGLTRIESSGKKWHAIQKKLINSNAFVSDALRQFESYPLFSKEATDLKNTPLYKKIFFNPGKQNANWWSSSLVRIELTKKPKPFTPTKGNFYHDKETLSVEEKIGN